MDEQAAPWPKPVWLVLGAASIAFHLWLIFSGLVPNLVSRPLHMALAVPWIMFAYQGRADIALAWMGARCWWYCGLHLAGHIASCAG
jgi:hypothetical protein